MFEVSDYAAAYPESKEETLMDKKDTESPDAWENNGLFSEVHGWPSGGNLISATGVIRSIDQDAGTFIFSDFEDEVTERVGTSSLEFQKPEHPSGGIVFEELHEGMQITISFLWPRTASLTGVVIQPDQ